MVASVGVPVAGDDEKRVLFPVGQEGRARRVAFVDQRNPVVHDRTARIDGEADFISGFFGDFDRTETEIPAGPDNPDRLFPEVFLDFIDRALKLAVEELVGRRVAHRDIMNNAMRLVVDVAFLLYLLVLDPDFKNNRF